MKHLNLKAENPSQELVKRYLEENVSDILAEKINNGKKTLQGCWNFIVSEAKKKAVSNCACIEDRELFGWAIHYFEEDSITEQKTAPTAKTVTTKAPPKTAKTPPVTPKAEAPKQTPAPAQKTAQKPPKATTSPAQVSIFDLF